MRLSLPLVAALMLIGSTATAETITSTVKGTVVPARAWDVSAEASNKIGRIHFIESQMVSKGDLLLEFDTLFKELELRLAEAEFAKAKVALEKAEDMLSRQEELREKATSSEVDYFDAKFAAWMAKADHDVIEAKRDMAAVLLKAQNLYAPFDGQISAPRYRENANVNIEDSRAIATVVLLDPIFVRAPVPMDRVLYRLGSGREEDIHASISVNLKLPDGSEYPHSGRIKTASVGLDKNSQEASVLVEFPNPDRILRPGMVVEVTGYED